MGNSTIWIIAIGLIIAGYFIKRFLRKKLNMPKGILGYISM